MNSYNKMQNTINRGFFHEIPLTLVGGMWKRYSVRKLL